MATIHPEPKLVFIAPDGDGGWHMRVTTKEGEHFIYPLTLPRITSLVKHLMQALFDVMERPPAPPDGGSGRLG